MKSDIRTCRSRKKGEIDASLSPSLPPPSAPSPPPPPSRGTHLLPPSHTESAPSSPSAGSNPSAEDVFHRPLTTPHDLLTVIAFLFPAFFFHMSLPETATRFIIFI